MGLETPWVVQNQTDVARFFRVNPGTVREWRQAGMPGERGRWDLSEIYHWRMTRRAATPGVSGTDEEVLRRRRELEVAKLEEEHRKLRIANEAEEGKLLDRDDVHRYIAQRMAQIRSTLLSLGSRVANVVPGELKAPIKSMVENTVAAVLEEADNMQVGGKTVKEMTQRANGRKRKRAK